MSYQSGFISIIGCPNVGKSTLLNALVGQKIAIVTNKAQTTRNKITGVLTGDAYQMIFLDTPGLTAPKNKLGVYMQKVAVEAWNDVEAILFVVDAKGGMRERDVAIMDRLKHVHAPVLIVLNKIDLVAEAEQSAIREALKERDFYRGVLSVSAKTGEGLPELIAALRGYLVEGPQYFPPDMVTDQPERVICAELIREKALLLLSEEVPHGVGVGIDQMQLREDGTLMDMYATIYCERESHKGILIGRGGSMLKKIGSSARQDIEWLLGVHVNLQLHVKSKEDWRNRQGMLSELGYQ